MLFGRPLPCLLACLLAGLLLACLVACLVGRSVCLSVCLSAVAVVEYLLVNVNFFEKTIIDKGADLSENNS